MPARRPHPLRDGTLALSAVIILAALVAAAGAEWLAPVDPIETNLGQAFRPPVFAAGGGWANVLGTDHLGRDIFSRILFGARVSLTVGLAALVVAAACGTALGLVAGYYGGWWDELIMRLADVQLAVPVMMLAVLVAAVLGPSFQTTVVVLGATSWIVYARLVRAETMRLKTLEYIVAARALGATELRQIVHHILPGLISPLTVLASFTVAQMIVFEAALSFLGLGVKPPWPSWGVMLADGRPFLWNAWWVATFPGLAIVCVVLAINLLGDWLRDRLDPRLRGM